jgi:hypothetical protein
METSSQNLNAVSVKNIELDESPSIEKVEALVRVVQQYREEQQEAAEGEATIVLPGNVDSIEEDLEKLRIGPAAPDWDAGVREAWAAIEGRWASRATLEQLEAALALLLEPLQQTGDELDGLEAEVRIGEERVETLSMLAAILDELTRTPPAPGESDSAKDDEL